MHSESYDRAASDLLTVCRLRPDSEWCALKAASACQLASRYETTLRVCDELLKREPDSAMGHYWRGRALSGLNDFQGAIAAFDHAILLDPKYADMFSRRSMMHVTAGDFSLALRDIEAAIAIDPSPELFCQAATYHGGRNDTQAAINCLRKGLELHPASEALQSFYTMFLFGIEQEHAIEEKYRTNPTVTDQLTMYRGMKALGEKRFEDAVTELSARIERDSALKPGLIMLRAEAYFELGELDLSQADVNWLLEQPEHRTAGLKLRGSLAFRSGNFKAAEADLTTAIAADPTCVEAHISLADIHRANGDFNEARLLLAKVESHGSDDASLPLARAKIELSAREPEVAIAKCNQALAAAELCERNAQQVVQLREGRIVINAFRRSSSSPAHKRYMSTIKALTLRSYAQAQQGCYAAALADAWQFCTLPVVSK